MTYVYSAYGLTIEVPFACPVLVPLPAGACPAADVVVREGPVPLRLPGSLVSEQMWDAVPGVYLLRSGPGGGRFLIEEGEVTFSRDPGCDDVVLARRFVDWVLGAVLRQRGIVVLHANAVEIAGGAILISGESGAGKSTTTTALLERGCRMLSDDVAVLRLTSVAGQFVVAPGAAQTHLTKEAADRLGFRVDLAQLQPWRRMKAAISTHGCMATGASRLLAIYVLQPSGGEGITISKLLGYEKFAALQEGVYGTVLFAQDHAALFPLLSQVVEAVPMFRIARPRSKWSVAEVSDAVIDDASRLAMLGVGAAGRR